MGPMDSMIPCIWAQNIFLVLWRLQNQSQGVQLGSNDESGSIKGSFIIHGIGAKNFRRIADGGEGVKNIRHVAKEGRTILGFHPLPRRGVRKTFCRVFGALNFLVKGGAKNFRRVVKGGRKNSDASLEGGKEF